MDSSVRGVREIQEFRLGVPSERTAIIGKNHREDQRLFGKAIRAASHWACPGGGQEADNRRDHIG